MICPGWQRIVVQVRIDNLSAATTARACRCLKQVLNTARARQAKPCWLLTGGLPFHVNLRLENSLRRLTGGVTVGT